MKSSHFHALIMAGGRGTRFWPRSRRRRAKQVLTFFGDRSLIQQTVDRLAPLLPPERIWIITSAQLRAEICKQLPEVPARQILAEPVPRNTAPCIGLAAHVVKSRDPDAVLGVFPADHLVARPTRFRRLARAAFRGAADGRMIVLGIPPQWPETGFGYIEFGPGVRPGSLELLPVLTFREKPDLETARAYVASGRFFWNAGMFFWRADVFLDALARHLPRTSRAITRLPPFDARGFGARLRDAFPRCDNISVDYAILEREHGVAGLAAEDIGWNDVGSWNAVYALTSRDRDGNAAHSEILAEASRGNLVDVPGKLTALLGVTDLVVVETPDALLIASRNSAQKVGELVKALEKRRRFELL